MADAPFPNRIINTCTIHVSIKPRENRSNHYFSFSPILNPVVSRAQRPLKIIHETLCLRFPGEYLLKAVHNLPV